MKYFLIILFVFCFVFNFSSTNLFAGDWGDSMLGHEEEKDDDGWGKDIESKKGEWGEEMFEDKPDKWGKDIKTPKNEWGEEMFPEKDDNLEDMPGGDKKPFSPLV